MFLHGTFPKTSLLSLRSFEQPFWSKSVWSKFKWRKCNLLDTSWITVFQTGYFPTKWKQLGLFFYFSRSGQCTDLELDIVNSHCHEDFFFFVVVLSNVCTAALTTLSRPQNGASGHSVCRTITTAIQSFDPLYPLSHFSPDVRGSELHVGEGRTKD